ncbi:hypothetical protein N658DRAFT_134873 [Parathielavia hyrcaniae]|uniref:Extracellular serine-rich protein n=1 Tax=Parathielavia hyrcaniae TaxID=113614 RepID=A0AAN6T5T2_9PEZI|nr:hypothetical protein N658DRAFT_134873 [Parathielavia hyrcaniae]
MFAFRVLTVFAALAATAAAQDDEETTTSSRQRVTTSRSSESSSTSSSSTGPATVAIAVGANGHFFTPQETTANVGDIIKFNFYPGGHRVVRAEFAWPCIPYEYANINEPGFDSGEFKPQVVSSNPPNYQIHVNDTEPIFFYCAAPYSCSIYHMIGVINPNSTHSFSAQMAYAENVTYQLAPGEPFPSETPIPTPTPSSGSNPYPGSGDDGGDGGGGGGLSPGAIAGIAIGSAAVLILAAALIYLCGRRGGFERAYRKCGLPGARAAASAPGPPGADMVPDMAGPSYAADAGGLGLAPPKSAGQATMTPSSAYYGGQDNGTLRSSSLFYGGTTTPSPSPGMPSPGTVPAYAHGHGHGYGHGGDGGYGSPYSSPRTEVFTPMLQPPPVELPTGDHAPVPTQSPPPGYQAPGHWAPGQETQYRAGGR